MMGKFIVIRENAALAKAFPGVPCKNLIQEIGMRFLHPAGGEIQHLPWNLAGASSKLNRIPS
jgi:hypothetical protein